MAGRQKKRILDEPPAPARRNYRPSPRFALQISLGLHALIVLVLFRMVSEYAREPQLPLESVARSNAPRPAATPSFVAATPAAAEKSDEIARPAARAQSLPHQETSFAESHIAPLRPATVGARRVVAPAVLPATSVALPADEIVPLPAADEAIALSPAQPSLGPADTLEDLPTRVATRTIYGPRAERPLGLAVLPADRDDNPPRRPADAYAHRFVGTRTPKENRSAIEHGLEFLARTQLADGRWQFRTLRGEVDPHAELPSARADAAATGLALLAFLGAGCDHLDGRYRYVVDDALQYLVRFQRDNGEFFRDDGQLTGQLTRFYGHGIATLALCEAFGMTGDQRLRAPAQRALDYLVGARFRQPGSWRYLPGVDAAASTIGWQLATLRSGQLAGLNVSPETLGSIRAFLVKARDTTMHKSDTVNTAVGLAVELHLNGSRGEERLRPAANELLAHPPEFDEVVDAAETDAPGDPRRDTYYWYYGSEAMYRLGGDDWRAWSGKLYPRLIQSQLQVGPHAGSWDPASRREADAAPSGGRLYVTAMNLLSLEIQNRQLPPDYQSTPQVAERPHD